MLSSERYARLTGWGAYAPDLVVTNADLEQRLDTTDAWITTRTGIRERRWADSATSTGDMAVAAGRAALACAGVASVDRVVLATSTPDHVCPATAPWVADRLGLGHVPAHDLGAVCSGFLYALGAARDALLAGSADRVLVIGADRFTTLLDPDDRGTRVIFGDGAGAVVLESCDRGGPGTVGEVLLGADGSAYADIIVRAGGSRQRLTPSTPTTDRYFTMAGRDVFSAAVTRIAEVAEQVMARSGWSVTDRPWLVAHQANVRILAAVGRALGLPDDRIVRDLDRYGNTSAASVPMALAHHAHLFRAGDRVVLAAFGGGTTWGATTLTWPGAAPPGAHRADRHRGHLPEPLPTGARRSTDR